MSSHSPDLLPRSSAQGMRGRRLMAMAGAACALAFVVLGLLVGDGVPAVDRWIVDGIEIPPGSVLHQSALVLSTVGVVACFLVLVTVAVRAWRRSRRGVDLVACTVLLVLCAAVAALQYVYRRPGPPGQPIGFSYPSGHASISGALAVTTVVVAAVFVRSWLRTVLVLQCTAVVLTMAARVALAEHYLTDVLGAALGVCAVGFLGRAAIARWWSGTARTSPAGSPGIRE